MNELQIFKNPEFGEIRTVEINNEPWFVGKDVASVLGYKDTVNALKAHVDEDEKAGWQITTQFGVKETTIINESGLYSLILSSKLSTAKKFKRWVTSEVLPTIRKHGAYMTPETLQEAILNPDMMIQLCQQLKAEQDKNAALKAVNSELMDSTLNKLACQDKDIRALLEECVGYCFYRRNELGKAFILTGDKSNGKSTFLDVVAAILGEDNISTLDIKELGDRFSTSMMFGKLANIADDIGDDFLQGTQVSVFKKVVTGNRIKAERKGQDPFEFSPYVKILASANEIPRMKDKTGAVLRRLVIIPFNATFSKDDPDYRPFIKYDLMQPEALEYMIALGMEGLKRVISNRAFTVPTLVQEQLDEYEESNNPIIAFLKDVELSELENEPTSDVYRRYNLFCTENSLQAMSAIAFTKQLCRRCGFTLTRKRVDGEIKRVYEKE